MAKSHSEPGTGREAEEVLVLASGSPRRRDLLMEAGIEFEIRVSDIPEVAKPGERPSDFASRLAGEKALAVAREIGPDPDRWVLGADTIVVLHGDILGKPDDPDHAVELLGRLLGNRHCVITSFALVSSAKLVPDTTSVESFVTMRNASIDDVRDYVAGGEPLDKAGAYAVQGEGARFVERVEGSLHNVIGLPVAQVLSKLAALRGPKSGAE